MTSTISPHWFDRPLVFPFKKKFAVQGFLVTYSYLNCKGSFFNEFKCSDEWAKQQKDEKCNTNADDSFPSWPRSWACCEIKEKRRKKGTHQKKNETKKKYKSGLKLRLTHMKSLQENRLSRRIVYYQTTTCTDETKLSFRWKKNQTNKKVGWKCMSVVSIWVSHRTAGGRTSRVNSQTLWLRRALVIDRVYWHLRTWRHSEERSASSGSSFNDWNSWKLKGWPFPLHCTVRDTRETLGPFEPNLLWAQESGKTRSKPVMVQVNEINPPPSLTGFGGFFVLGERLFSSISIGKDAIESNVYHFESIR